jgi:uncharacterized protein (DUF362 family)
MEIDFKYIKRRRFLKQIGLGVMGAAVGGEALIKGSPRVQTQEPLRDPHSFPGNPVEKAFYQKVTEPAHVGLVKGNDRREIVYQALKNIEDDILRSVGTKKILIKPNMVSTNQELSATHVDAIRAILDFLTPHYKNQIIIGESTASRGTTHEGFKNYNYLPLEKEYNVKLVDLNEGSFQYRYVFGRDNRPQPIRILSTFLDPDVYLISAARMKTHDRVLTTLSLKNILLASPVNDYQNNDKRFTHMTSDRTKNTILHYNMFHLAQEIYPHLGVIDGFVGMEGDGPTRGTPYDSRVAMASVDPLALDILGNKIMGFDPGQILYLTAMTEAGMGQGDLSKIQTLGTPLEVCQCHFKPAERMAEVYQL